MKKPVPIIECGSEVQAEIQTRLVDAIVGKPAFYSDHLGDLVRRHCPDIYDIADRAGFRFVPSNDKADLAHKPPLINFDIVRKSEQLD